MVTNASRLDKKRVSHDLLHNLSLVDILFHEKEKKRRNVSKSLGFFEGECVVTSQEDSVARIVFS